MRKTHARVLKLSLGKHTWLTYERVLAEDIRFAVLFKNAVPSVVTFSWNADS